jgi:WD40 repeat protein
MSAKIRIFNASFIFVMLIAACSTQASPPPTRTIESPPTIADYENAYVPLPTRTATPVVDYPVDVPVHERTPTPVPTLTKTPRPAETLSIIGTSLPEGAKQIHYGNHQHLKRIAQWGRGSMLGVGFAPDGTSFVAVSEMGWSIYTMDSLDQPPQWVAFDEPILFDQFYFNKDGTKIRFDGRNVYVKDYPSGKTSLSPKPEEWIMPDGVIEYASVTLNAPDGTKVFRSRLDYGYDEEIFTEEKSVREMYDRDGNLLYTLRDNAPYVTYFDRNGPEGCDLSVFSPCGNALMAVATTPVKALFSADSKTFAALYASPSLYFGIMRAFSYVRIYDSANGDLIGALGGFTKPVQDFNYSPDGKFLIAGFVDGSLVLWDIQNAKSVYGTRHINAPAWKLLYSPDSKYLLIQRASEIEVRLTRNGSLVYRFNAVEFAVSSLQNLVALGDAEGNINIRNLDTGRSIMTIRAHEASIYSIAFSPDGLYLASSGQDCDIKLWDLQTGKLLHYFEETAVDAYEIGFSSRIFSTYLEFIPGTNMLIGFGSWGTVVNWNVNSGATNYVIQSAALEYYNGIVTLKPHFPEFFDVDVENNRFYVNENAFDLATGESLGTYAPPVNLPNGCAPSGPVTKDGAIMFTRGYETREGNLCILDAASLTLLGEIYVMPESDTHIEWVDWLYLSPDGRQLIVTVGSGVIYVYQIVQ